MDDSFEAGAASGSDEGLETVGGPHLGFIPGPQGDNDYFDLGDRIYDYQESSRMTDSAGVNLPLLGLLGLLAFAFEEFEFR